MMREWLIFVAGALAGFGCAWFGVLAAGWRYRNHRIVK
jgi:hypothetical protein